MRPTYTLIWRRDSSEGIKWYIRGIRPDGSFYGEVLCMARQRATSVDGHLPPDAWQRCQEILRLFEARDALLPGACFALLARWSDSLGQAEVLFKYNLGDEVSCADAQAFVELKGHLEKEISKAYPRLV